MKYKIGALKTRFTTNQVFWGFTSSGLIARCNKQQSCAENPFRAVR